MRASSIPMRRSPRARLRERWLLAVLCAVLVGCASPGGSAPTDPGSETPAWAPAPATATGGAAPVTDRWGAYGSQEEACAAVAGHVLTLSVLPSSLRVTERVQDVQRVEDDVAEMVATVPAELVAEFSRIQLLVDSYGEVLTASEATAASEATIAPGTTAAGFDAAGLESSLASVREWLTDSCAEGAGSL